MSENIFSEAPCNEKLRDDIMEHIVDVISNNKLSISETEDLLKRLRESLNASLRGLRKL